MGKWSKLVKNDGQMTVTERQETGKIRQVKVLVVVVVIIVVDQ